MVRALALLFSLLLCPLPAAAAKAFKADDASNDELLAYLDDDRWDYRVDAARALGDRCLITADEPLARRSAEDPNTKVRLAALVALAGCGMPSTRAAAEAMALSDEEAPHRIKAVGILEREGSAASVPVLAQVLTGDVSTDARRKAATVLRKKGWPGAEETLALGARSDDADLRAECVLALVGVDRDRYQPLLHASLRSEPGDKARLALVRSVENAPVNADRAVLIELLDDPYDKVARHAARALVALGDPSVAPILAEKALVARDRKVKDEFVEAAAKLGG